MNSTAESLSMIAAISRPRMHSNSLVQDIAPTSDVFRDIIEHINATGAHRNEFKNFIHVYSGIHEALQQCLRSLEKIMHSSDCNGVAQACLCRYFVDLLTELNGSIKADVLNDMRGMKTAAKEKLSRIEQDVKNQAKEITNMIGDLERCSSTFDKLQVESKSLHAKTVDSTGNAAPRSIWSPSSTDKDKIFTRLQKIESERDRLARESEDLYSSIVTRHTSSYSRITQSLSELASMRRRLNRRIVSEIAETVARTHETVKALPDKLCRVTESVRERVPAEGDFNMALPSVDQSLAKLVGVDRESRVRSMRGKVTETSCIEYRAIQTYIAKEQGELSFTRNEKIQILRTDASGWWTGRNESGQTGIFPCVLVVERPAGAPLPLMQKGSNSTSISESGIRHSTNQLSHRPHLLRDRNSIGASPTIESTWKSTGSIDERVAMIRSRPPGNFCAVAHFPYYSNSIYVEAGDWVKVDSVCNDNKFVIARNSRGQCGRLPLNIMTVKEERENDENIMFNW